MTNTRLPIVVLISGRGSNLQSIIDAARRDLPVEIRAVISNRSDALGLQRARAENIPTAVLDHRAFPSRDLFDRKLITLIEGFDPGLVVLAGFMRILTPDFARHFQGRLINIHPSLLPQLPGLHTHERAIRQGLKEHGASVHFVTEEVDGGPIIIQARVPVLPDDTPDALAARVLEQEHRIFPQAIRWFVEGRLRIEGERVRLAAPPL
uniref:Phosphoribosylglycinamide formyltransferase n=1 Tax=Candidatus Kentrum sp. SD TaxID=2126332 RepID=A0A450YCK9_9GAMM|nr:MAG: formyltetrahydrofolate-dependent phosphoribosylglycinamide formyltransferase [Candidatus Kentron sp. SD]VFK44127.1 MAG: formyltetrahydrofolate-dependent phosphoribosylglycinamide formyltransferase [Candidatus Kentron sp. SD]VFK79126.1 MAG: formyltetrahydrofolate-dependent phosphoribosylglycinamide formyltransferase [Candidatus Kentron sp. SD]